MSLGSDENTMLTYLLGVIEELKEILQELENLVRECIRKGRIDDDDMEVIKKLLERYRSLFGHDRYFYDMEGYA